MIKAFLSFIEEDLDLVNLFRGQAKNKKSDLEFADHSVKQPYNSSSFDYISRQIATKIGQSSLTICLYGPTTYTSDWVNWELEKSLELGKPLIGVRLYSDGSIKYCPAVLKNWPRLDWNIADIVRTIESISGS